jgi:arylformamidase
MTEVVLERAGERYVADLGDPLPIAIPLDFDGAQPNHFEAPRAHAAPLTHGHWVGEVLAGGTVNCAAIALVPHCNGTHTECVGHITEDRVSVTDILRGGLHLARVVTVKPTRVDRTNEETDPLSAGDEWVITAAALQSALDGLPGSSAALVIRTLPNDVTKLHRAYDGAAPAPYLTVDAARLLVAAQIDHLVCDLPSLDRAHDDGRLQAHRTFWGLPAPSRRSDDAHRGHATITELAWIAPMIRDGWYLLDLQMPAFLSDAAPSRPLLYPLRPHE